jgi:hypothetical protein
MARDAYMTWRKFHKLYPNKTIADWLNYHLDKSPTPEPKPRKRIKL